MHVSQSIKEGHWLDYVFVVTEIPLGHTAKRWRTALFDGGISFYTGCKEILLVLLKLNNSVKSYSFRKSFTPIQNRSDRIYVKCH